MTLSPGTALARVRAGEAWCWWGACHKAGGCPVGVRDALAASSKSRSGSLSGCPMLSPSLPPILVYAYVLQESNGPTDAYAAIAKADRLTQEPESIRKWREEQKKRLEELDAASKVTEQEWREKAKKDLEEWNLRQNEQMEKNRANNRIADKAFYQQPDADVIGYVASEEAFLKESKEESPGSEWEKVAQLCDFNPKSSKQSKDVSRMRSVLISLKQTPLSR
uniref:Clathrin light chain n=1 Tax=Athene cunicularia TaxID=194338 RepID=A0A663MKP0_ATHCN